MSNAPINLSQESIIEQAKGGDSRTIEVYAFRNLHKTYPNWNWRVECDPWGGVLQVQNMSLSTKYGYVIKLRELNGKNLTRKVINAGGEILERWRQRRGKTDFFEKEYLPRVKPHSLEAAGGDTSERVFG